MHQSLKKMPLLKYTVRTKQFQFAFVQMLNIIFPVGIYCKYKHNISQGQNDFFFLLV